MPSEAQLRDELKRIAQEPVLRFWSGLNESQRNRLHAQFAALDLKNIAELIETQVKKKAPIALPKKIEPVVSFPRIPAEKWPAKYIDAARRGRELLADGKIGAFLVAGGQGTRLGYDGPKGEYPVTPIKNKPLFQVFAEQLLAHSRDAGKSIPWYIMTSEVNDARTRQFFQSHNYFGYPQGDIFFFQQGMMPAFSMDGKILLAEKDSLALSPDGHGGSLRALAKSGALADMRKRGIEYLSYFQVDNPLVHCIDPLFIGLHDHVDSEMSSKTINKLRPLEKVGNFVMGDDVLQIIEYSDLPESLAQQTTNGQLTFNAGSIAIHVLSVAFIERLNSGGRLSLPWHRAEKKVPFVDDSGNLVKPENPNAVKLEQFVFDAIPLAKNAIVYQTLREEEFSPVKNAEGGDSPTTSRRDQVRRSARWLRDAGVNVPMKQDEPEATIEVSPLFATSAEQLRTRVQSLQIQNGATLYLE